MRRPIIAANWKMYNTIPEAVKLVKELMVSFEDARDVEVVLAPPFTALVAVRHTLEGRAIGLAGQNMHWEEKGAFTGEISPRMLTDVGCRYVILGHSERRQYFGETDETVNKKISSAIKAGLIPIVCVGETLAEREADKMTEVVGTQLTRGLNGLPKEDLRRLVLAYEPIWAIGTGKTATPQEANGVHKFIRGWLEHQFGAGVSDVVRIQYGGSVKPENIDSLMAQPDIDGALVGGASLKAQDFARIIGFKKESKS